MKKLIQIKFFYFLSFAKVKNRHRNYLQIVSFIHPRYTPILFLVRNITLRLLVTGQLLNFSLLQGKEVGSVPRVGFF